METNHLTPALYPNYFTCLNIIVNLCNYAGPSWSHRMTAYLKTYSVNELRKANHQILREKLRGFDAKTKERFLSLWYESYVVVHDRDLRSTQFAEKLDYVNSTRRLFHIWQEKYEFYRELEQQAKKSRDLLLKQNALSNFADKYSVILKNTNTADTIIKRRALRIWKKRYLYEQATHAHADEICERNIKQHILETWDQNKTEKQMTEFYNKKIANQALDHWLTRTREINDSASIAEEENRRELLSSAISQWMHRLSLNDDMTLQANELANRLTLSRAFQTWKRRTVYDYIEFDLENRSYHKHMREIFNAWRMRTLQLKEARRFRDFMSCYNQFQVWRIKCRSRALDAAKKARTAEEYFKIWHLEEKQTLFTRVKNSQLAVNVLNHWRHRRNEIDIDTNDKLRQVQAITNTTIARNFLRGWKYRLDTFSENYAKAVDMYDNNLLGHALDSILCANESVLNNEEKADRMWRANLQKRVVINWRNTLSALQRRQRQTILEQFLQKKNVNIQKKSFNVWVKRSLDMADLNAKCDMLVAQRQDVLRRDAFDQWTSRYFIIARNIRLADTRLEQNYLEKNFEIWKNAMYELEDLKSQADSFLYGSDLQRLERVYRIWRMRMFKLKTKGRDAIDFHQRLLDLRFRTIWRFWKLRTQDIRAENSFLHQKNIRTSARKGPYSAGVTKKVQMSLPPKIISAGSFTEFDDIGTEYRQSDVLETPTRTRIRKPIPLTFLGRWRRNKTPAGALNFDSQLPPQQISPSDGR